MKRFALKFALILSAFALTAQVPAGFSYQAVVRNNDGEVVASQPVRFRFTILQNSESGTPVYSEIQDITTNEFGLANLVIGEGTPADGIFSPGGWGLAAHFLKIELDVTGGSAYTHLGTLELMAVPYAFHAQTVEVDQVDDADADATNEIQELELTGTVLGLSKSSKTVILPSSGNGGDNWGTQVVQTDTTLTGQGTDSSPLGIVHTAVTPGWNNIQGIPEGFADGVDDAEDADADATNEIQELELSGTVLGLSKSSKTVILPSSGNGGDNWGTQVVMTNITLTGQGTGSSPLGIVHTAITPGWNNIQGIPEGFADGIDDAEDADADSTNEIQELLINGNVLSLSLDGGSVELPASGTGPFVSGNDITRNIVLTDNFVFGSSSLDDITGSDDNKRMFFNKSKGAFRAGEPFGTDWDDTNVGNNSVAFGIGTKASGLESFAAGHVTNSSGMYSTALGAGTQALGMASTALGGATTAYGDEATSVGYKTLAAAKSSFAAGRFNVGSGTPNSWVSTDPVFEIGIGSSETDKANAVTVLKNGNVGIGPANPGAKLEVAGQIKITGGNPGDGKVLTSDANGLASWLTPSSGGSGDDWGSEYVHTDATLEGQGTASAPLKMAQQSAATGQVLKWNGTSWAPAGDEGGEEALTLPYTGTGALASDPIFTITNTGSGSGIKGKSSATSGVYYGVIGESSSVNGSGVYASSPYMGVEAHANASNGTAIWGYAYDSEGTNYGIKGVTNSSNGYSGFFDGGRFHISGNTGIGVTNPTAKLEVAGQVKITGGNPGAGKVLTSDAVGLASWQTASGGFVLPYSGDYGGADAAFSINQSGTGNAIYVYNPAETGEVTSISAHNNSSSGTGIAAIMHATSGTATGISGFTSSSAGTGVKGLANSGTGINYGVKGESKSVEGVGVWGTNTSSTGITYGVQGSVSSSSGYSGYFLGGTFCVMSNVGIGSSSPSAKLEVAGQIKITGGSPGSGKVLTSDVNGLASWITPAAGQWQVSGSNIYFNTGNAGIGTSSPEAKLDVSASQGPNLIIRDSDGGSGRPGIQFSNNNIHYIGGDDGSEEVFGFYSGYGSSRTYAAKLNVHGPASGSWGRYIGLTHDGSHGRIYTDAGYLVLEPSGQRVGLGTDAPTQNLDVNGNARFRAIGSGAYSGAVNRTSDGTLTTATSDERLKENINTLQNNLGKVMQLRGVSFTWKSDPQYGRRIGFIAQEFEKVIPELVFTNEFDGYKGINYAELTAVIVEAVKEQQRIIESLKTENDRLKKENDLNSRELRKMKEVALGLNERLLKLETFLGSTVAR